MLLSLGVLLFPELSFSWVDSASLWVRNTIGYFYLYLGLAAVLFVLLFALSPWGKIKLGDSGKKPEHSLWSWIAMLYSAGMGAGILLRAVQEPVFMARNPPINTSVTSEVLGLEYTFYQWGFTAWAFYGIFAAVVGYSLFNKQKKVRISSAIEDKIRSRWARSGIDLMTILTTVFGLIAAIGLGATQISGGLEHLNLSEASLGTSLGLTTLICVLAFISAWKGLNKGIKILSQLNILLTLFVLLFVLVNSPILRVLKDLFLALYHYIIDFIPLSLATGRFDPGLAFLTDWTFYYWAFWLAWAPFTGIFIARISKGRTLRQLLLGVMIIPSIGTFIWFSAFGATAFEMMETWSSYQGEFDNVFTSIFTFFQALPLSDIMNGLTILLLIGFLVTSVDSAVLVLSMFTDRGKLIPRKSHRLLWAALILFSCMALLVLGNIRSDIDVLVAAQKILIITSLPFAAFLMVMVGIFCYSLARRQS